MANALSQADYTRFYCELRKDYSFGRTQAEVEKWCGVAPEGELPAQDPFCEQAVLGSMLLESEAADIVLSFCHPSMFRVKAHQTVFLAARAVAQESKPVDLVTVSAMLRSEDLLDECGGPEYLTLLLGLVPITAHVRAYCMILRDLLIERVETSLAVHRAERNREAANDCAIWLEELRAKETDGGLRALGDFDLAAGLDRHLEQVHFAHGPDAPPHFDIPAFDELMGGLPVPGLVIVKGGTKEGKTALALQAVGHWALPPVRRIGSTETSTQCHGKQAVYVTLEMDPETQAGPRFAHLLCGPTASGEALHSALAAVMCSGIEVMDKPGATIEEIAAELRRRKRRGDYPALTVVDHVQLVQSAVVMDERLRLQYIAERLKTLAKELHTCMVAPSQVTYSEDGQEQKTFGARFLDFCADRTVAIKKPGKTAYDRQMATEARLLLTSRDGPGGETNVEWTGVRFREAGGPTQVQHYRDPDPERGW